MRKNFPWVLYVIQMGFDGPIKIGITTNLNRRLISLQTANPSNLRVMASRDAVSRKEAELFEFRLHRDLKRFSIRGEWFLNEALRELPFREKYLSWKVNPEKALKRKSPASRIAIRGMIKKLRGDDCLNPN